MSGRSAAHRRTHSNPPRKGAPTSAQDGPSCSTDSRTPRASCSRFIPRRHLESTILVGSFSPHFDPADQLGRKAAALHPEAAVLKLALEHRFNLAGEHL